MRKGKNVRVRGFEMVLAGLVLATPAFAANVQVSNAWFRSLPAKVPAGGYFTLHNSGTAEIALTGAQTPVCSMLMLHKSSESGGMSSMDDVASVPVAPGGKITFAPGGYHLMCMDPSPAMVPGGTVAVTLRFSDGSRITTNFAVRNAQGK
jgi:periplasmic copper chaperone A